MAQATATRRGTARAARFAPAKFRPTTLPTALVTRSRLLEGLSAGAGSRLTVMVGSAGAGKSVLLSSWAAARSPGVTSWLSCDSGDADPVRFWTGFIEASRMMAPEFGADATDLLAMDNVMRLLHQRSEGWAAALQMAALSLRGKADPARAAHVLDVRNHAIAEYFISEVLERQAPEVARFMLQVSILSELTAAACAAVTGRQDAAALLRGMHAANLFVVALDDERTSFRYHHLVRQVLRAELRSRDRLREQSLQRRPISEFLILLDLAEIWAARGQIREALAGIEAARDVLPGAAPPLLNRADELETLFRLSLGDLRFPCELASLLPAARGSLLRARTALATGDQRAAVEYLRSPSPGDLTPRRALVRQIILAAAAIERDDPMTAGMLGSVLETGRREGFLNTIVSTAPQVTSWLVAHATQMRQDPFLEKLIFTALEVRATQPDGTRPRPAFTTSLSAAEVRILKLLPTSTYLQIAATLYISRNTVKSELRSIYQKLGASSRAEAIERAVELRLL